SAMVVGHVGRLAPEKNLGYLAEAVVFFLKKNPEAFFLVAGSGPSETDIRRIFKENNLDRQLIMPGTVSGQQLSDVFKAMDIFVFASKTETQGMVLTEAMAAGKPVVAFDAPGAREVVQDGENGFLLQGNALGNVFAKAMGELTRQIQENDKWRNAALNTAKKFSRKVCAGRMVSVYESIRGYTGKLNQDGLDPLVDWDPLLQTLETEWALLSEKIKAVSETIKETLVK
ncbi:MAG: glycosyltransferase, partial [Thermodesulfobacteriota bacterium]|nr:glycosyltransferase [Thermodesulfobacteriota bacterium]